MADTTESQQRKGRPRLSLSEKKRRKAARETEQDLSRIRLGDQFVRWRALIEDYEVTKNKAEDEPMHTKPMASTYSCFTSTPGQVPLQHIERMKTPSVSEVFAIESGRLLNKSKIWLYYNGPKT